MSRYTTEVRYICESKIGLQASVGYTQANSVILQAAPLIFEPDIPFFDSDYRLPLETKILRHYYTQEIGAETVGLWMFWLNARMHEIMPYYNQLYKSQLIKFDPMHNIDLWTDHKGKEQRNRNLKSTLNQEATNDHSQTRKMEDALKEDYSENKPIESTTTVDQTQIALQNNTPQSQLIGTPDFVSYLTSANKDTVNGTTQMTGNEDLTSTRDSTNTNDITDQQNDSSTAESTGTEAEGINTTEDYLDHIAGKNSSDSYSKLLLEFRETFLNIDMMIIKDLADLFMGVW